MDRHALVVGKFYPPHAGHHKLINTALAECDRVTVAACYSSVENIDIDKRVGWLTSAHRVACDAGVLEIIKVKDDTPVQYTDETWGFFLEALMESLDWQGEMGYPNVVYSGEDYAPEFARRLDDRYEQRVFRDVENSSFPPTGTVTYRILDRSELPISASQFRDNPAANWDLLAPATRAGLCKRVVVCGAESSGTTTLARGLAELYRTTVVPEYGRHFDEAVGRHHRWASEDFMHIAREQKRLEDNLARYSQNGLLICDTDEYATAMFHEVYMGTEYAHLYKIASRTPADLYIITDHAGVEFEDDGTRANEDKRPWMTKWLTKTLPYRRTITVTGRPGLREKGAMGAIDKLLQAGWDIAQPIEYRDDYEHAAV